MHNKAWGLVDEFMQQNLKFFSGRAIEAESTVLPAMASWIHDTFNDIPVPSSCFSHFESCLIYFMVSKSEGLPILEHQRRSDLLKTTASSFGST